MRKRRVLGDLAAERPRIAAAQRSVSDLVVAPERGPGRRAPPAVLEPFQVDARVAVPLSSASDAAAGEC